MENKRWAFDRSELAPVICIVTTFLLVFLFPNVLHSPACL